MTALYTDRQHSSRLGTTQTVAYTASSTPITNAFSAQTYQIRLASTTACNFLIGDGVQTALVSSAYLPANFIDYITVSPGQRISAITATGSTNGSLAVTEVV